MSQLVRPCIWFQTDARGAVETYTSLIPNSKLLNVHAVHDPDGNEVLTGDFILAGVHYQFLSGPAPFQLNESFSLAIECETQEEIDHYWDALVDEPSQCGWLRDRWGVSWQVYPRQLPHLLGHPNPVKARAAAEAMFSMSRIVLADIEAAVERAG